MTDQSDAAIRVSVLDESFTIQSEATSEYTERVAAHVDQTLRSLRSAASGLEPFPIAVLGAMEITDSLFRSESAHVEQSQALIDRVESLSAEIEAALEINR